MAETFIINEIIKTHSNASLKTPFYYYRDSNGNEVDLVMLYDGGLKMIECKAGIEFGKSDVSAFGRLATTLEKERCIVCFAEKPYPIVPGIYAVPIRSV